MRGLKLSDMLGSGVSCNGNNVAYLAGSAAPLSAYGLDRKHFSKVPFQERPGPAISSSYTNSLGFTIQVKLISLSICDLSYLSSKSRLRLLFLFRDNKIMLGKPTTLRLRPIFKKLKHY